jgi:uncharacterized protein
MTIPHVVFADASFYTALLSDRDEHHNRAVAWREEMRTARTRMVTTQAVLWEVLNTFAMPPHRRVALAVYQAIGRRPDVLVVGFEPALIERAVRLYGDRADKPWGTSTATHSW